MSGETEADVSGWTIDTLREYMLARFSDLREMLDERYSTQTKALDAAFVAQQTAMRTALDAAEKAVATALTSAEKAVTKAETAAEKRFESVNEFRQQLADQSTTFLTRTEYDVSHNAMEEKVAVNADRIAALELRITSRLDLSQGTITGSAEYKTERRLDLGQVIAVVAVIVAIVSVMIVVFKG